MTKTADYVFEIKSPGADDWCLISVTGSGEEDPTSKGTHLLLDLKKGVSEDDARALSLLLNKLVGGYRLT